MIPFCIEIGRSRISESLDRNIGLTKRVSVPTVTNIAAQTCIAISGGIILAKILQIISIVTLIVLTIPRINRATRLLMKSARAAILIEMHMDLRPRGRNRGVWTASPGRNSSVSETLVSAKKSSIG